MGSKSPQPHSQESALEMRLARAESEGQLNSSRITLLRSILDSSEETYFLSSRELAKRYGVDIATVVRTTQALGYERFADFGADLRKHFVMRITPYRAMKTATEEGRTPADHIANSVQKDLENITQLRSRINVDRVLEMAKQIRRARRVLIVGLDFAASLAWCLDYHLTVIGVHSEAPVGTTGNLHYKLRSLNSKDLLIAISFGRCLRETVNAAIEARSRGVAAVGITDTQLSPIARYCDSCLLVSVASPSLAASYAAAMALVNALVTACAHISPKRSLQVMAQSEKDYFSSDRWFQENPRRAINGNRKNRQ
jgi:DNA-binding MurR/RpiR family transcriptional regulator